MPLRILFVTQQADSPHIVKWVGAAIGRGHEVRMICTVPSPRVLEIPTTIIDTCSSRWAKLSGRARFALSCRQLLRRYRPDLVHVHYLDPTLNVLGYLHFDPVVISVWGGDLIIPRNPLNEWLRRKALQSSKRILAASRVLAYVARAHVSLEHPVTVVPFGVDCDLFRPLDGPQRDGFCVGCVKSFEEIYGIAYLVRAVAMIRDRVPELKMILVGKGRQEDSIRQLCRELGLEDRVHFPGWIPNAELPRTMAQFDVMVMPSLYESFGVSALEASACGVPVIASDAGGIPEVVVDGQTGLLVPPGDPQAIADRLLFLHENRDLARELGRNGRAFVREKYEWSACVEQVERIYQRLLAERGER